MFYTIITVLGLSIGSFLNVVVYRLPLMLEREWRTQCHDYLEMPEPSFEASIKNLGIASPGSSCPHCGHKIRLWENIPLLSYLFLRGKCAHCKTAISFEYPLVESITALLSVIVAMRFGVSLQTLAALVFTWMLLALTVIDLHKQLLPDTLTLPLIWMGLLIALPGVFVDINSSVIGAMAGYMVLWLVFQTFKLITGKEGMGFGDFKLLAALGAWNGWMLLPQIILISSVIGAVVGILMIITGKTKTQQPIPFGPYLALAGWIALMWGNEINQLYLGSLQ